MEEGCDCHVSYSESVLDFLFFVSNLSDIWRGGSALSKVPPTPASADWWVSQLVIACDSWRRSVGTEPIWWIFKHVHSSVCVVLKNFQTFD